MIQFRHSDRISMAVVMGPAGVEVRLPHRVRQRDPQVRAFVMQALHRAAQDAPVHPDPARPLSREEFQEEVRTWCDRLGVSPGRCQLRTMSSRWGSCSSKGTVTFSDRALELPAPLRQYLICHELVHLLALNHGPDFRRRMSEAIPDWRKRNKALGGWVARRALHDLGAAKH